VKRAWGIVLAVLLGGCTVVVGDGTYHVSSASSSPTCSPPSGASACHQCTASSCCAPSTACDADAECTALVACEARCTASTCITDCETTHAGGVSLFRAYFDCLSGSCPICAQSGVGDPCTTDASNCAPGLTCNGLYCTRGCVGDSDCAGAFDDGLNGSGGANVCAINGQKAAVCFPGCSSSKDCATYDGTTCVSDTASVSGSVQVCATTTP
jgi:hypothetical protein